MALTLQIENLDRLEDGGPAHYMVDEAGFQAGRGSGMDWVLPDPARHVSSHHFDITYEQGAYWLTDVSTNGTFLLGQPYRLDGPHRVADGNRFQVGRYVIVARLGSFRPRAQAVTEDDPWAVGSGGLSPVPVNPAPMQAGRARDEFGDSFIASPAPPPMPPPEMKAPAAAAPIPAASSGAFLKAFCEGAGLDAGAAGSIDEEALARELGKAMRSVARDVMAMLKDRSSAKQFTLGGERTMLGSSDNNPLKFLPDTSEALEALFLKPRPGFLEGEPGLADALSDIRAHQAGVFAALQPALAQLLDDLSPEAVEAETGGSGLLGGSRKAKAWELFVERWDAKAGAQDNGMLDVFLAHFAEAYSRATEGKG